jgi:hypothetical protein
MAAEPSAPGKLEPGALILGVAALFTVLGSFTLTGTVGRVMRNEPGDFRVAIVLLLVGAAVFAAAALPFTKGIVQSTLSVMGIGLTAAGLASGLATALGTADDSERPAISAALSDDGLQLKGKVTAANLSSDTRLVLIVDGLVTTEDGKQFPTAKARSTFPWTSASQPGASTRSA